MLKIFPWITHFFTESKVQLLDMLTWIWMIISAK